MFYLRLLKSPPYDEDLANTGGYAFPESARHLLDVPESERGQRELTDVLRRLIGDDVVV